MQVSATRALFFRTVVAGMQGTLLKTTFSTSKRMNEMIRKNIDCIIHLEFMSSTALNMIVTAIAAVNQQLSKSRSLHFATIMFEKNFWIRYVI